MQTDTDIDIDINIDTDTDVTHLSCCLTRGIRVVPPTSTISSTSVLDISGNKCGTGIRENYTNPVKERWNQEECGVCGALCCP
jgi:hypothetical protein